MEVISDPAGTVPDLGNHKHFPVVYRTPRKSNNHLIRAAAKRYAHSYSDKSNDALVRDLVDLQTLPADQRRPLLEGLLTRHVHDDAGLQHGAAAFPRRDKRKSPSSRMGRGAGRSDEEEGRRLARSNIPLPVDRFRRRPSLEREDAFRDESTSKRNVRLVQAPCANEDAQIAELYQMGILYDDDDDDKDKNANNTTTSQPFDLNSIRHEQSLYPIRPSKRRSQRSNKGSFGFAPLNLDLSFSDVGNDELIARLLAAAAQQDDVDGQKQRPEAENSSTSPSSSSPAPTSSPRSFAPLRVVYELSESGESQATLDVDTSQPPDLIMDDYDCFSDEDLERDEDMPSQREVDAATPGTDSGAWVMLGDVGT